MIKLIKETVARLRQFLFTSFKSKNNGEIEGKEDRYSVFYKYGDEANDFYLTRKQAMKLADELEKKGHEVIVAKLLPDKKWMVEYATQS